MKKKSSPGFQENAQKDETLQFFGLFDKRSKMMDPKMDARLGFTTSFGYCPHGIDIPAWKAVFFNPKTTEAMVDRIVESIEEL